MSVLDDYDGRARQLHGSSRPLPTGEDRDPGPGAGAGDARARAELGRDKADALVKGPLRDWSRQVFAKIGDGIEGSPGRKFAKTDRSLKEVTLSEVTFEMHCRDKEALEFDVTSCRFAEFFRALGEPELGAMLVCSAGIDIAAAGLRT
jgi:hypothetical protein